MSSLDLHLDLLLFSLFFCFYKKQLSSGTFREKLRVKRLEKVRLAFDKIDVGNDGILNREEVVAAAHSLGMTPEEAGLFFDSVDHDGSGFLDKREIDKEAANHVGMA